MPNLINIEKFFLKTKCCTNTGESRAPAPCQNSPPHTRQILRGLEYFTNMFNQKVDLNAATITIGNQKYGSLSAKDQYTDMVKTIKKVYRKDMNIKYIFFFELTKNGQLHAHGIVDGYEIIFKDGFQKYGKHNTNDKSYESMVSLTYIEYIKKEWKGTKYPPITNITKQDL